MADETEFEEVVDDLEEIDEGESDSEFSAYPDLPAATHWPSLSGDDVLSEWTDLRRWVEALRERFAMLDHHVIPPCWWRHNGHVEALAALRDHERVCYSETAPASASVDWMRALRDVTYLLALWTGDLTCGARHEDPSPVLRVPDYDGWEAHCRHDRERRQQAAGDEKAHG
jgi:hypothetical protein